MKRNKGVSSLIVLSIILGILVVSGGVYLFLKDKSPNIDNQQPNKIKNKDDQNNKFNIQIKKVDKNNQAVIANNKFAFKMYQELTQKGKNIFFSPLSISSAFAMVYEGAEGKTASDIASVMNFPADKNILKASYFSINNNINKASNYYKLNIANALWAQKDYSFLDLYFKNIEQYYDGKATNLDFINKTEESRQTINKWVESKTNDKIKDLIPGSAITSDTKLILTNAIYFKGQWEKSFDSKETGISDFKVADNTSVKVPMMKRIDKDSIFNYGETNNLQILEMPYTGNKLSMVILLPKDQDISSLEKTFSVEKINEWKKILNKKEVDVYLPKFKFDTKYPSMVDTLQKMGMVTPFINAADFSGMDGKKDLSISQVIHQAFIEVNEEGTEAAAATAVLMELTSAGPGGPVTPVFNADHPFIFMIQDVSNGNILFIGKVEDPTK